MGLGLLGFFGSEGLDMRIFWGFCGGRIPPIAKYAMDGAPGDGGDFVGERGGGLRWVRAVSGSFDSLRSLRITARTGNDEEQEQTKAKCWDPSTTAAKYAASGRDDGFILFPVGMTAQNGQRREMERGAQVASL
jgi:hypothetical protein